MVDQPNIDAVILDYLRRGPASTTNVASHFCLPSTVAQHKLARMEVAGLIKRGRSFRWAALAPLAPDPLTAIPASDCATHNGPVTAYPQTTPTIRCPECNCPNGWHSFGCATGVALLNDAVLATRASDPAP